MPLETTAPMEETKQTDTKLRLARRLLRSLALVGAALLALPAVLAADCDHRAERTASESAAGLERVEVDASAGSLRIEGLDGAARVEARGEVCASSARLLERVELRSRRSGRVLYLEVRRPENEGWRDSASMDLEITLPSDLEVEIDDGSGETVVLGATVGKVDDGSGNLRFENTRGRLVIDDGSGNIEVRGHQGTVVLEDGSGNVRVRDVQGDVRVRDDGSGDLLFERISGDVMVEDDGSGDIEVDEVGGDFVVRDAGSGSVRYDRVSGRVDVPDRD